MDKYSIETKESAQKELDALDDPLFKRIDPRISALASNPRPTGCRKLKGYKDQWRIRVGDYRIVYNIRRPVLNRHGYPHRPQARGVRLAREKNNPFLLITILCTLSASAAPPSLCLTNEVKVFSRGAGKEVISVCASKDAAADRGYNIDSVRPKSGTHRSGRKVGSAEKRSRAISCFPAAGAPTCAPRPAAMSTSSTPLSERDWNQGRHRHRAERQTPGTCFVHGRAGFANGARLLCQDRPKRR